MPAVYLVKSDIPKIDQTKNNSNLPNYQEIFCKAANDLSYEGKGIIKKFEFALLVRETLLTIKSFANTQILNPFNNNKDYHFIDLYSCLNSAKKFVLKTNHFESEFCLALSETLQIPSLEGCELAMVLEIQKTYAQAIGAEEQVQNLRKLQFGLFANFIAPKHNLSAEDQVSQVKILIRKIEKLVGSEIPSGVCHFILFLSNQLNEHFQVWAAIEILEELGLSKLESHDRIKQLGQLLYFQLKETGTINRRLLTNLLLQTENSEGIDFDPQTYEILTRTLLAIDDPTFHFNLNRIAQKLKLQIKTGKECPIHQQIELEICIARSLFWNGQPKDAIAQLLPINENLSTASPTLRLMVAEILANSNQKIYSQTGDKEYYRSALSQIQECLKLATLNKDYNARNRALNKFKELTLAR